VVRKNGGEKTIIFRTKGFACVQFYKTKSTVKTVLLKVSSAHTLNKPRVDSGKRLIITPSKCVVGVHDFHDSIISSKSHSNITCRL